MKGSSIKAFTTVIVTLIISLFATGCVTQKYDSNERLVKSAIVMTGQPQKVAMMGQRFAWHPSVAKVIAHEQFEPDEVVLRSQNVIGQLLNRKGYQLVEASENPDFLVGFGVALESRMSDDDILNKVGLVAGLPTVEQTRKISKPTKEKGSLYIGFFPSVHQQSVWRILAQGYADFAIDTESQKARHESLLAQMLNRLPVSQ